MKLAKTQAARIAVVVLGGGLALGTLMAMAVPTAMPEHGEVTWRDRAEPLYATTSEDLEPSATPLVTSGGWEPVGTQQDPLWRDYPIYTGQNDAAYQTAADDLDSDPGRSISENLPVAPAELQRRELLDAASISALAAQAAAADVIALETAPELTEPPAAVPAT